MTTPHPSHPLPTPAQIAELQRLHEQATPGEWMLQKGMPPVVLSEGGRLCIADAWDVDGSKERRIANAGLIVASHNALPGLLTAAARVAELEAALIKLRDCDWVITLPDRMDAVRDIARTALKGGGE